ncbi:MAG: YheT family hydrolase [Myxococcota bacterium]
MRPRLTHECWGTPDGDFLELDLCLAAPQRPHVLVLHGLEGSSQSGYVSEAMSCAAARGFGAVAMSFRGCGQLPNRHLRSYNSGDTTDARWVLNELRRRGIDGPLLGIGFSLGANMLLRLLGEDGERCELFAAAALCAPFDLSACMRALDGPGVWARIYRERLLRPLKQKALEKAQRFPGALKARRIAAARTLEAFDEAVTAPLWGFSSAAEYYAKCSSGPLLPSIHRPTLLLSAADDPFIPASAFPGTSTWAKHPFLAPLLTEAGGHVGHIAGSPLRPFFWAEAQALSFLTRTLQLLLLAHAGAAP